MASRNPREKSIVESSLDASGESPARAKRTAEPSRQRSSKDRARQAFRRNLVESLEARALMAAGPQLIGIQPNNSDLLEDGAYRNVAPRELTFRFNDGQTIDTATVGTGIRVLRSGGDGSFGVNSAATDFGTSGRVEVLLTAINPGQAVNITLGKQDLGLNVAPTFLSTGLPNIQITLNSNATTPTTATQLVNAINATGSPVRDLFKAEITGGFADVPLGTRTPSGFAVGLISSNDQVVPFLANSSDTVRRANEITLRFPDSLTDDVYRVEVFGFDDPSRGVTGLKNTAGELFVPTIPNSRQDRLDFRLDLGPRVTGVIPQPTVRKADGSLDQLRDQIQVFFDGDNLLVENDSLGNPTARSAENPDFYQLINTRDTVRNTDDGFVIKPIKVVYDALRNSATLTFADDLHRLNPEGYAYRLRVGTRETIPFAPVLRSGAELGDTFTTADNLGIIGSAGVPLTSLIVSAEIKNTGLGLDLLGASDDPGHRNLGVFNFENHINEAFLADFLRKSPGTTKIFYNFRSDYAAGTPNAISEVQKLRVREALGLWSRYLGIEFTETPDLGITFVTGDTSAIGSAPGQVQNEFALSMAVRIDPAFENSMLILGASRSWNTDYAEDYFRVAMTGIGMLLGLEHAADLPASNLLAMNTPFLNAAADRATRNFESVFPGPQDVLHGQYLHRPDSSDIDLYKFQIDFGPNGQQQVGFFEAETFAERSEKASALDTHVTLYQQKQATASSNLNAGGLLVGFEAVQAGILGNNLQLLVARSPLPGANPLPVVQTSPNLIRIELDSTPGSESTVQELIDAINNDPQARQYVRAQLLSGAASTVIGNREVNYSPIRLQGGGIEKIAQNDNYFSEDSLIRMSLGSGTYYLGVSAAGNDAYDPNIPGSGNGGRTEGRYDLRLKFRAQVGADDTLRDRLGREVADVAQALDGDGDGLPGGIYNFWFQTRDLRRVITVEAVSVAGLEGQTMTITGANGVVRRFEFDSNGSTSVGSFPINYLPTDTPGVLASKIATAIANQIGQLGVAAAASGNQVVLGTSTIAAGSTEVISQAERSVRFSTGLSGLSILGKTIFVDKVAGPNADGTKAKPFNNLQNAGVPNAFGVAQPGDIVRIVGNGGADGNLNTLNDNLAYEFGFGLLPGSILSDGDALLIPKGVTAMVDAGAIFKSRRSRIAVGSSNLDIDRSGAVLQILGTPDQNVIFTSWLDESVGKDNYGPVTTPDKGNWGGIIFQRDVDRNAGRLDLEDEGIFLNYVNNADIRYGGGSGILIDSVEQVVNPIQIIDSRPTIIYNRISQSADAAVGATPNSFAETLFTDLPYQYNGSFTADYDRVGPDLYGNRLTNNSINGLFIRITTLPGETPRSLTSAGRLNDVDITYVLTENLLIEGTPGGNSLDRTRPLVDFMTTNPVGGGSLAVGAYTYKVTFVDRFGNESLPSDPVAVTVGAGQGTVEVQGIPGVTQGYSLVRLYRRGPGTAGVFKLVEQLESTRSSFIDRGLDLGGTLVNDQADLRAVTAVVAAGGSLAVGPHRYRMVMVDAAGRESIASEATVDFFTPNPGNATLNVAGLPATLPGFVSRRLYRSSGQANAPYVLVANLAGAATTFTDNGSSLGTTLNPLLLGEVRQRPDASLVVDPGAVFKVEGARLEIGQGAQLLAEGTGSMPIIFTSRLDDRTGVGGVADTNNDGSQSVPTAGNWGGIYVSPGATLSLDHAAVAYAGGITRIAGTFRGFNALEIQQGDARVVNTVFENNESGFGGQGPDDRFGLMTNAPSVVYARGSQPIFIDNTFVNNQFASNAGNAITIDQNSLNNELVPDRGRMTGAIDRFAARDTNRGPLFRGNRFERNETNGLEIRGDNRSSVTANTGLLDIEQLASDTLSTESVWDDTDIVHVLREAIYVGNLQHASSLSLLSSTSESLVVKLEGEGSNFDSRRGTGIYALGNKSSIADRVGGTLQVIGQPGFPVVFTSLRDDTIGAGLRLDDRPQTDTNDDGVGTIPRPGDWNTLMLDQDSNDRNVATVLEAESLNAVAPGTNGSVTVAQNLGLLAASSSNSDENLRLGFVVRGVIAQPEDQDVYSFSGIAGTEVWIDIDRTAHSLDTVLELLDANGILLARSDDSTRETAGTAVIEKPGIAANAVNPLNKQFLANPRRNPDGTLKEDGTSNPRDAGLRVVLPGTAGVRTNFFFRVRSQSVDRDNAAAGITTGSYEVQVRLREAQEFPGSTIQFSDVRYATNGVHVRGLPGNSPLLGEESESNADNDNPFSYSENRYTEEIYNGTTATNIFRERNAFGFDLLGRPSRPTRPIGTDARPQHVGNVLASNRAGISVAGSLSSSGDVDFYRFTISEQDIASFGTGQSVGLAFDIDYADGLTRPDTSLSVYRLNDTNAGTEEWQLIHVGEDSNIADDRQTPLNSSQVIEFSAGSVGTKDPFIHASFLQQGEYLVAVTSASQVPNELADPAFGGEARVIHRNPGNNQLLRLTQIDVPTAGIAITVDLTSVLPSDFPQMELNATGNIGNYPIVLDSPPTSYVLAATLPRLPNSPNHLELFPNPGLNVFDLSAFAGQRISLYFPTGSQLGAGITVPTSMTNFQVTVVERATARRVPSAIVQPQTSFTLTNVNPERSFPIDLRGSSAADRPSAYFDYSLTANNLQVAARVGATTTPLTTTLVIDGKTRQEKVDLSAFAGQQFDLVFQGIGLVTPVAVNDMMVGFAERGERIENAPRRDQNSFNLNFGYFANQPATGVLSGPYQLEIRRVENRTVSNTNERFSASTSLTVPDFAAGLRDGHFFTLSDGVNSRTFEFVQSDSSPVGVVNPGNIAVRFASTDSAAVIAGRLLDAINSPAVQSRLNLRAASADGRTASPITGRRLDLFGNAIVSPIDTSANPIPGTLTFVILNTGTADQNIVRDQGQVVIANNTISESRDFGVWSEAGTREYDPRDIIDTYSFAGNLIDPGNVASPGAIMQARPPLLSSSPGPVRNLLQLNNTLEGGFAPSLVIANNIVDRGGLGGIHIASENTVFMITPNNIPPFDHVNSGSEDHFGDLLDEADPPDEVFWIDGGRTRVSFEFEDVQIGTGGDGWDALHVPIFYRGDAGTPSSSGYEFLRAMYDAILNSILVTNGTTQHIKATLAMSTLPPIRFPELDPVSNRFVNRGSFLENSPSGFEDSTNATVGYLNWANRPALYLEGVTGIYDLASASDGALTVQEINRSSSPQAFARVINNTIVGTDGTASRNGVTTAGEANATSVEQTNDTLATAVLTMQGIGHTPETYTATGVIGDNRFLVGQNPASDVDMFQIRLDIGDRVFIDVDTVPDVNPRLNAILQLFDASGRPVNLTPRGTPTFIADNVAAPIDTPFPGAGGETLSQDPFIDYTATSAGVYYVAISSAGNAAYNPRVAGSSVEGSTTGAYSLEITVAHPQTFVITIDEEAEYTAGDTFEIYQIPDVSVFNGVPIKAGLTARSQTFEFTNETPANYAGPNTPIFIGPANNNNVAMNSAQIAEAIADAINRTTGQFGSALNNRQNLFNGGLAAANPLLPVSAVVLGGADAVEPGLRQFSAFSRPGAQRFIAVSNAAAIASNPAPITGEPQRRSIRVDPDLGDTYNLDQIIPETGVFVSGGASPTILNNVFYNVQSPIVSEETRTSGFGPGGNAHPRPNEIIIGGSIYQYAQPVNPNNNLGIARHRDVGVVQPRRIGIELSPTNVPNTAQDFNTNLDAIPSREQLFVNVLGQQYLPRSLSRLIDSSIDSLTERAAFNTIKTASGISPSPIIVPSRDAYGQLRVDDPNVSPPQGIGGNVFKDRGALDRADFTGPSARLGIPLDNDNLGVDVDATRNNLRLTGGVYNEFRIQIADTLDTEDPFPGVGVDDDTVLNLNQPPRLPGAAVTIREDGRTLTEGIDYVFSYDRVTNEVILTPLAGVWRNDKVYEITLNNRDRFVMQVPVNGNQIVEGEVFQIYDNQGGVLSLEFESGYTIQLPQALRLQVPQEGAGLGGVRDGDEFAITFPVPSSNPPAVRTVTFEMDRDGVFASGVDRIRVPFLASDGQRLISQKIFNAIVAAGLPVSPRLMDDNSILLGADRGASLGITSNALSQPDSTLGLRVITSRRPDGQIFTISDGNQTLSFELDSNNLVAPSSVPVDTRNALNKQAVADAILAAISNSTLKIKPEIVQLNPIDPDSDRIVYLGLPSDVGSVQTLGTQVNVVGVARTLADGGTIRINGGGLDKTFEFDSNGSTSGANVSVPFTRSQSEEEIGEALAAAIRGQGFSADTRHLQDGNVAIGESATYTINLNAQSVALSGNPGVQTGTRLAIIASQHLTVADIGALRDGDTFTITANGTTVTFEFDNDSVFPTLPTNVVIPFSPFSTPNSLANAIAAAINQPSTGLGLTSSVVAGNSVRLGASNAIQVGLLTAGLVSEQRAVNDADSFTIRNGATTATFEFEDSIIRNGLSIAGRIPILFTPADSIDTILNSIIASIQASALGLNPTLVVDPLLASSIAMNDTVSTSYDLAATPSLVRSGFVGGVLPVEFIADASFTREDLKEAILRAIQQATLAGKSNLIAADRGGDTLFVENATLILSPQTNNYFLSAIKDLAGNDLRSNRVNRETEFTIIMPDSRLDFGDAPDPFTTTDGRYPTLSTSNGARHAILGQDEIQVVGWNSPQVVSGTFTLSFEGQTTAPITVPATAAMVQTQLEGLSTIGAGNVSVTMVNEAPGSTNVSYRVTFSGALTSLDVAPLTINVSNLSFAGGSSALVEAVQRQEQQGVGAVRLGRLVDAEAEGRVSPDGKADRADDGVVFVNSNVFGQLPSSPPVFNRNFTTGVTVTASQPGYANAWIDFNFDGDWDDAGEQVLTGVEFSLGQLTQTFALQVPTNFPQPDQPTTSFARFRISSVRALSPTGIAPDGEVEDYAIVIHPGLPATAVNDQYSMIEDLPGTLTVPALGGVTANDTPSGVGLSALLVTPPAVGTLTGINTTTLNNGSFTYTAPVDFFGDVTFTYRSFNGILGSVNLATVTISVKESNDAPVVPDLAVTASRNGEFRIGEAALITASNAKPGPANESFQTLKVSNVSASSSQGGTVAWSNGQIVYRPAINFIGSDSFTYRLIDNGKTDGSDDFLETVGTVVVTVQDKNDPPLAINDTVTVSEDPVAPVVFSKQTFTANDTPGFVGTSIKIVGVGTATAGGIVSFDPTTESISYLPPLNFFGTDTFTYTIEDDGQTNGVPDPERATATVTVTVLPVNDAPVVTQPLGTLNLVEDGANQTINLVPRFADVDGDVLTYSVFSNSRPTLVTPTISAAGVLTLDLLDDQNGTAVIVIRATDPSGATVDNTLTLNVSPVADAPRLVSLIPDQNVLEDALPIVIEVSPNFIFDPDVLTNGDVLTITATSSNTGLVTTSVTGTTLRLTLVANQSGQSTITVRGTDSQGQFITDTFVVNVAPVNDAPLVFPRSYTVPANGTLVANDPLGNLNSNTNDDGVLTGASDVEGDLFNAVLVRQPTRGAVQLNANGTFTYTPSPGGLPGQSDTFTFQAIDVLGAQSAETIITINYVTLNPSAHQNPTNKYDVNADGFVSPIDALIVINFLNNVGSSTPVSSLSYTPPPYRDVNGDFFISPIDVLQIINRLNRGEGEGEGPSPIASQLATPSITVATERESEFFWSEQVAATRPNALLPMATVPVAVPVSREQILGEILGEEVEVEAIVGSSESRRSLAKQAVDFALLDILGGADAR